MHEIHPAHSIASWKEILIHIGIITIGLLMALGIDQTVEYFHHRHQLKEIRHQLDNELEMNKLQYRWNLEYMKLMASEYRDDLAVLFYLRQHPGAPRDKWPAKFQYDFIYFTFDEDAWRNFERSSLFNQMPYDEQRRRMDFYFYFDKLNTQIAVAHDETDRISKLAVQQPDLTRMNTAQLEALIDAVSQMAVTINKLDRNYHELSTDEPNDFPAPQNIPPVVNDFKDFKRPEESRQLEEKDMQLYFEAGKKYK